MRVYGQRGVAHLWLVDPLEKTLETYSLNNGIWAVTGLYSDEDEVRAAPFDALTLRLGDLWEGGFGRNDDEKGVPRSQVADG